MTSNWISLDNKKKRMYSKTYLMSSTLTSSSVFNFLLAATSSSFNSRLEFLMSTAATLHKARFYYRGSHGMACSFQVRLINIRDSPLGHLVLPGSGIFAGCITAGGVVLIVVVVVVETIKKIVDLLRHAGLVRLRAARDAMRTPRRGFPPNFFARAERIASTQQIETKQTYTIVVCQTEFDNVLEGG